MTSLKILLFCIWSVCVVLTVAAATTTPAARIPSPPGKYGERPEGKCAEACWLLDCVPDLRYEYCFCVSPFPLRDRP